MVVVDASVVYKWFVQEAGSQQALQLYNQHVLEEQIIVVPDLILYELANAWVTKTNISTEKIKANLEELQNAQINIEPVTFSLVKKIIEFSRIHHTTTYDASYVVLAQEKKCDLITADKKFVTQVDLPFVKYLGN